MKLLVSNLIVLVGIALCARDCPSQLPSVSGPLKTIEQALSERGVQTDHNSLMNALKGSDQVTQGLAATELARQHAEDAAPYIISDFKRASESVPRLNLAHAMMVINKSDGLALMTELCQALNEDGMVRLDASRFVRNAGLHNCDRAILEVPISSEDPSTKLMALSLLDQRIGTTISPDEAFALEARLLNDENNAVRVAAAQTLVTSGEPGANEIIRNRIFIEQNADVRESLSKILEESRQQPGMGRSAKAPL